MPKQVGKKSVTVAYKGMSERLNGSTLRTNASVITLLVILPSFDFDQLVICTITSPCFFFFVKNQSTQIKL